MSKGTEIITDGTDRSFRKFRKVEQHSKARFGNAYCAAKPTRTAETKKINELSLSLWRGG
jgi:hypothetical protein